MIDSIMDVVSSFVSEFWTLIVSGLNTLSGAFYNPTDNALTFIGTIVFIGLGLFLVMFVINFIRNLVKA